MKFHERQNPPPKSWEQFEDLCLDLYRRVWRDPRAQKNGRRGQEQHGVDVFGQVDGTGPFHGVQCKGKDGLFGAKVTAGELRDEVEKAKAFRPPLKTWTLATTGPADQAVQQVARELTDEHTQLGLFSVHVSAWDDLVSQIKEHPELIEQWYPEQGPTSVAIQASLERIETAQAPELLARALIEQLQAQGFLAPAGPLAELLKLAGAAAAAPFPAQNAEDVVLQARIDEARDLIRSGHARAALSRLEALERQQFAAASPNARFRLLANKGAALLSLGRQAEGTEVILEAVRQTPADPKALTNEALARLLRGENAQARAAAKSALSIDPSNSDAAALLIHSSADDAEVGDPFDLLPPQQVPHANVLVAAARWYRHRDTPERARALLEQALGLAPEDTAARAEMGTELLVGVLGEGPVVRLESEKRVAVDRGIRLLAAVWEEIASDDRARTYVEHAANLIAALRFRDRTNEAKLVLEQALRVSPDHPALLKHRARLLLEANDAAGALAAVDVLAAEDREAELLKAGALIDLGRYVDGISLLDHLIAADPDATGRTAAVERVDVLWRLARTEDALTAANQLVESRPKAPDGYVALARILRRQNDLAGAAGAARAGLAFAGPQDDLHRLVLAEELYAAEEWDEAADAFGLLANPGCDSLPLRRRLVALFRADRRRDASELLASLAPQVTQLPFYRRAAAVLSHRAGDREAARRHAESYLRDTPDDLELRLLWLDVVEGLGDRGAVERFLDGPLEFPQASARHSMILARALDRHDRGARALALAYGALRRHRADPDAHRGYFGLLFMGRSAPNAVPRPGVVGPDTAFVVRDSHGDLRAYVIEADDSPPPDPTRGELHPRSALASRAEGLRRGDRVRISESDVVADEREIVEVKHKYLHALHLSLADFNSTFPAERGLQQMRIDEGRPGAVVDNMLPVLKARREHAEAAIERYRTEPLPIAVVGALLGCSTIEAWHGLVESGVPIDVCVGTGPERERALTRLTSRPGLVLDPLTLWIAEKLRVADALVRTFGPLGLTASGLDVFAQLREQRGGPGGRRAGVAVERDGRIIFREESAADARRARREAEEIHAAARRHTRILPAIPARDLSAVLRSLEGELAANLADPIFAASGADRVFLSEDARLRQIASQEARVPCVWLQPALMVSLQAGDLDQRRYCDAMLALVTARHSFTSLDAATLLRAAERGGWSDVVGFRKAAASLGGATIDLPSAVAVGAGFLQQLWTANVGTTVQRRFTTAIVDVLVERRSPEMQTVIVDGLRRFGAPRGSVKALQRFAAAFQARTA